MDPRATARRRQRRPGSPPGPPGRPDGDEWFRIAQRLHRALGGPVRVRPDQAEGEWVSDDDVLALLGAAAADLNRRPGVRYAVGVNYADPAGVINPAAPEGRWKTGVFVRLVVHLDAGRERGLHYSLVVLNGPSRRLHVFDTLGAWSDSRASGLALQCFGLRPGSADVRNHTGRIRQVGATCGAWACWLAVAYMYDAGGCRGAGDDVRPDRVPAVAVPFWSALTSPGRR